MTKHPNAVSVNVRLFSEPLGAKLLIVKFELGQLTINTRFKLATTIATASVIEFEHHVALLHQILGEIVTPAIRHPLRTRSTVHQHNGWVALIIGNLFWLIYLVIQALAIGCGEVAK